MIETIASTAITLPNINNVGSTPIKLQAANPEDVSNFNSILSQAKSSDMNAISVNLSNSTGNSLNGVENSLVDKFINMNKSYSTRKENIAAIKDIISSGSSPKTTETPTIATSSDIRRFSSEAQIRTNLEPENKALSTIENAQNKLVEAVQESSKKSALINDRLFQVAAWGANMAIFSAGLKSMSDGFKTLFRSSG